MTSFRRHVPTRFLINQFQTVIFLILKSDIIENSKIELRGIVLPAPSNQIDIYYYFTLQIGTFVIFSCFIYKLKEKVGGLLGGGGKRVCCPPPLKSLGWGACPPAPPPLFLIYEFAFPAATVLHIWLPPRLSLLFCFLSRVSVG